MTRISATVASLMLASNAVAAPEPAIFALTSSTVVVSPYSCDTTQHPPLCSHLGTVTSPPAWMTWALPTTNADGSAISPSQLPLTINVYGCYASDGLAQDCSTMKLMAYRLSGPGVFVSPLWGGQGFLYCEWVTVVDQQLNESALSNGVCENM